MPIGVVFRDVDLTTGAGGLTVENLTSGTVDFELGAGDVSIASLVATNATDRAVQGGLRSPVARSGI